MANENRPEHGDPTWHMPEFHFNIEIANVGTLYCMEVSGLDTNPAMIERRNGNMADFSNIKMPGLHKHGTVILKKTTIENFNRFGDWFNSIRMNNFKCADVMISLVDESGTPIQRWKLANAWFSKVIDSELKSDQDTVSIESIELVYESITMF